MGWTMVGLVARRALMAAIVVPAIVTLADVLLADPTAATAAELLGAERPGSLTPNQLFGGRTLTAQEAAAACGPAAAVAFSQAVGRGVSLDRAVAVARTVGWTAARGMTGPYGEVALLQRLNVPVTIEAGVSGARVRDELLAGRPVIIRTSGRGSDLPGHYFVAERIEPSSGRLDLAQSALVLRSAGGRRWYTLDEISSLGTGVPTHAIYLAQGGTMGTVVAASATPFTAIGSDAGAGSQVVATGGLGARLRATPGTNGAIVGSVTDGTRLTATGASAVVSGRTWKRVMVTGGSPAWIDAGLIRSS
jgi:hypothetical protein